MTLPIPLERAKIRSRSRNQKLAGWLSAMVLIVGLEDKSVRAEAPPAPCHANPNAAADEAALRARGDIVALPAPLTDRLAQLANRPHSIVPLQVFNEADPPSQLFQYYLLDTSGFEPNVFTTLFPSVNDHVQLTVTGGNCRLPTLRPVPVLLGPQTR